MPAAGTPFGSPGQTDELAAVHVITTVLAGTGSTLAPFGTLPPYGSRSPGLPVVGSRCSVAVGPPMRWHAVVVVVFLFLPVPVVLVVFTVLNSAYWLGFPCVADAWTRESRSQRLVVATGEPVADTDGGTSAGSRS